MRLALAGLACLALTAPLAARGQGTLTVHLKTGTGEDAGTATFHQKKDGKLEISLKVMNLTPGEHGVHIHQKPMCDSPAFTTAGGHFAPDGKQHGYENSMGHHNGDMPGNLTVGADGKGKANFTVDDLSLGTGKPDDIEAGTAIMIHAGPDDEKTDPSGNSGARVACGVIQK
jgi:Cu-Zn family superoxide dismutase